MRDLQELVRLLIELVAAVGAVLALLESRRTSRRAKRIERELAVNPQKSANAVIKKINGSGVLSECRFNPPDSSLPVIPPLGSDRPDVS